MQTGAFIASISRWLPRPVPRARRSTSSWKAANWPERRVEDIGPARGCWVERSGVTVQVTYVEYDGTEHVVHLRPGMSLMRGAVDNMVPGIEGDCGGLCACGTCHVYVRAPWRQRLPEAQELEINILDFAFDVDDDSRLCCQIPALPELDGIVVHMPNRQY